MFVFIDDFYIVIDKIDKLGEPIDAFKIPKFDEYVKQRKKFKFVNPEDESEFNDLGLEFISSKYVKNCLTDSYIAFTNKLTYEIDFEHMMYRYF